MSTLDQYDVLEILGSGSFGSVSKLRRKSDNKILVWKEINFGAMSEKEKSQLVAEVNILRELRNPYIVRYHDRIVDKPHTKLYIIMEHCSGGDLGRLIKKHRSQQIMIEEKFIWKVFAQIVLALKECHRRGQNGDPNTKPIIHRDLKPANILLDNDHNVKIADFGLAKELSSQSKLCKSNVGTPFYMSPEIINEKDYDETVDIWSLGCLLYELAALKPPFEAFNAVSLAMKINLGRFSRIPMRYSDALYESIKNMLQLDPKRRPRVEDLEQLPALQSALIPARRIVNEFQQHQAYINRTRELKSKEDSIAAREEKLIERENRLLKKEQELEQRLQAVQQQEEKYKKLLQQLNSQLSSNAQATSETSNNTEENKTLAEYNALRQNMPMRRGPIPMPKSEEDDTVSVTTNISKKTSNIPISSSNPSIDKENTLMPPPPPSTTTANKQYRFAQKPYLNEQVPQHQVRKPLGVVNENINNNNQYTEDHLNNFKKPMIKAGTNPPVPYHLQHHHLNGHLNKGSHLPVSVQVDLDTILRPRNHR